MRSSFLAAYHDSSEPANVSAHVEKSYRVDRQAAEIADPAMRTIVMELGAAFIGYAQLRIDVPVPAELTVGKAIEVARFYLAPDRKGDGSAQRLMESVRHTAIGHSAEALWLLVWQQAPRAQRFYEKSGFRIVGTRTFLIGDDAQADWLMACPVGDSG